MVYEIRILYLFIKLGISLEYFPPNSIERRSTVV
jgi:hypothetical protein